MFREGWLEKNHVNFPQIDATRKKDEPKLNHSPLLLNNNLGDLKRLYNICV